MFWRRLYEQTLWRVLGGPEKGRCVLGLVSGSLCRLLLMSLWSSFRATLEVASVLSSWWWESLSNSLGDALRNLSAVSFSEVAMDPPREWPESHIPKLLVPLDLSQVHIVHLVQVCNVVQVHLIQAEVEKWRMRTYELVCVSVTKQCMLPTHCCDFHEFMAASNIISWYRMEYWPAVSTRTPVTILKPFLQQLLFPCSVQQPWQGSQRDSHPKIHLIQHLILQQPL